MEVAMVRTKSRANNRGGSWFVGEAWQDSSISDTSSTLEFFITDGCENEDRPPDRGAYTCKVSGGYKLIDGKLIPFARALKGPVMVVSSTLYIILISSLHAVSFRKPPGIHQRNFLHCSGE